MNSSKAQLILEDGTVFDGLAFGAKKSTAGEVVFTTGMVGYDQSLTDPSYFGQILTFTYPLIGNWGTPPKNFWESEKIQVAGLVIADLTTVPNHWQSQETLDSWLKEENIPGIYGIDTRALTQKLRDRGVMLGKIVIDNQDMPFWDPNTQNLVADVSPKEPRIHYPPGGRLARRGEKASEQKRGFETPGRTHVNIALLNCGAKTSILRNLLARGATVYELPWNFDPFTDRIRSRLKIPPLDGLVISNGPGNPKMAKESIAIIKKALAKKIPTFGICLGNQLLALAAGGDTYKLKFGHRAQNQPTIEVGTKRAFITTHNHGYSVSEKKLPDGFARWFYNANDNTNEGLIHRKLPFFSVQFHPEAAPGPTDTKWLFDYFIKRIMNQES